MYTWWIIKLGSKLLLRRYNHLPFVRRSIGPYWTVAEALEMLKKWR